MLLVYIDDSHENPYYCFSALAVPVDQWFTTFRKIQEWRRSLKISDGIFITKEFHAWKFVSGRGNISTNIVSKWRRCQIFSDALKLLASTENMRLFNVF
jgi:hypothetical protein